MAKRKKSEIDITSNEQQNNDNNSVNKEIIEDNKTNDNKTNDNKITKKKNTKEAEYIITKKSEGVYIRKLRRL